MVAALALPMPAWGQATYYPRFGTEVRIGPYRPVLSTQPQVAALRNLIWDQHDRSLIRRHPLLVGLEFDYYVLQDFGLLGPLLRIGYWSQSGPSRLCRDGSGTIVQCTPQSVFASTEGVDTSSLNVVPLTLGLVYRYDGLRRNRDIPLTFSAKLGLDYHFWWGSLGSHPARYDGRSAKGGNFGFTAAIAAAVSLDGLARSNLHYGQDRSGQNNYIFAEYAIDVAKGGGTRLDFSDYVMVTLGLIVEFR